MRRVLTVLIIGLALVAIPARAQTPREGMLTGRLIGPDSTPVRDAIVRATQGPNTVIARSNDQGVYRLTGLYAGQWTITARRLGFSPFMDRVFFDPRGMRRDYLMRELVATLDPVLVTDRWTGVRGVVGDIRFLSPLADARVEVLGGTDGVRTDSAGRFAVPLAPGTEVVLRVEREGYDRQVVTATVPATGYLELDVALDTLRGERRDQLVWADLDKRLKFATHRGAWVGREELMRSDATRLDAALTESGTLTLKGLVVTRRACLFVDGVARPGVGVDAVLAGDVEFVEVYPAGADLTNTLASRWPPRAECGAPAGFVRGGAGTAVERGSRRGTDPQFAQFVAVWTRPR